MMEETLSFDIAKVSVVLDPQRSRAWRVHRKSSSTTFVLYLTIAALRVTLMIFAAVVSD